MADTRRMDNNNFKGLIGKNEDSLQGINTMSLQGGGGTANSKNLYQKQNTISSIRGGALGGLNDLDSIDEAPDENSLKHISEAFTGN